jgi:hypothetical protein
VWTSNTLEELTVDPTPLQEPIGIHRLARETHLPATWLQAEAKAGRIPCLKVGRRRLFNLAAVLAALAERAAVSREVPNAS